MATAELAVGVSAVVLLLGLALGAVSLGIDQVRCVDAARAAARALARGDDPGTARGLAARAGPSGAAVNVSTGGGEVRAVVTASRGLMGFGSFTVSGSATAAQEESEDP